MKILNRADHPKEIRDVHPKISGTKKSQHSPQVSCLDAAASRPSISAKEEEELIEHSQNTAGCTLQITVFVKDDRCRLIFRLHRPLYAFFLLLPPCNQCNTVLSFYYSHGLFTWLIHMTCKVYAFSSPWSWPQKPLPNARTHHCLNSKIEAEAKHVVLDPLLCHVYNSQG